MLQSSLLSHNKQYERRGVASVLFIDVDDFDMLVAKLQSQQLVAVLDAFFTHADQICERYGLITIETVGKEYMATSKIQDSLNSSRHIHGAAATVLAGLGTLSVLQGKGVKHGNSAFHLGARVGIHTGRVMSGVVGKLKPQYTFIGDTVNVANRMQGCGRRMRVHISSSTYDLLHKHKLPLSFEKRRVHVKGKGVLVTYFVSQYTGNETETEQAER